MAPPKNDGSNPFSTLLIVGPTCFFLGLIFSMFPYDYPLLWTSAPVPAEYYSQLEVHLKFLYGAPPLINRVLNTIIVVGLFGFLLKLFNPSQANVLFDGASLVLYLIGLGIYGGNIAKGLRTVSSNMWDKPGWDATSNDGQIVLGREDSLKVLAASNTILALVLVGVLVLQAGQWYAMNKEKEEIQKIIADEQKAAAAAAAAGPSKKKQ